MELEAAGRDVPYAAVADNEEQVPLEEGGPVSLTGFIIDDTVAERKPCRKQLADRVNSLPVVCFVFVLILIDFTLLCITLANGDEEVAPGVRETTWVILGILTLEVALRIVGEGLEFFKSPWNWLDFLIMVISIIIEGISVTHDIRLGRLIVALRILRVVRIVIKVYRQRHALPTAARRFVSSNRRRLREGNWDLDITYITSRIIAMSWPASGGEALYRNPIDKVGDYLNTKHKDHYRVYNLCAERDYNHEYFDNRVSRWPMVDHNTAPLSTIVAFCQDVSDFLRADEDNVAVIHCKGGKGRTGTMVAAFLLFTRTCTSPQAALEFFAARRTSEDGSREGVEEPSQERYVHYFAKVVSNNMLIPPARTILLRAVRIGGLSSVLRNSDDEGGAGAPPLWMVVDQGMRTVYDQRARMGQMGGETFSHDKTNDTGEFRIDDPRGLPLTGDVRVTFCAVQAKKGGGPEARKDVFRFWFHTAFDPPVSPWTIPRAQIDGAHTPKSWKRFNDFFCAEVVFDVATAPVVAEYVPSPGAFVL